MSYSYRYGLPRTEVHRTRYGTPNIPPRRRRAGALLEALITVVIEVYLNPPLHDARVEVWTHNYGIDEFLIHGYTEDGLAVFTIPGLVEGYTLLHVLFPAQVVDGVEYGEVRSAGWSAKDKTLTLNVSPVVECVVHADCPEGFYCYEGSCLAIPPNGRPSIIKTLAVLMPISLGFVIVGQVRKRLYS